MSIRMLDYYQKGLPAQVRQKELPDAFRKINDASAENMLEKPQGYPSFKRMGMDEEQIQDYLKQEAMSFKEINAIMIQNGRPPLFSEPDDTYKSSLRYFELIYSYHSSEGKKKSEFLNHGKESEHVDELIKIMGCTWEEYVPQTYDPEDITTTE